MTIIAIDTETGGFKPAENALLSITLIELSDVLTPERSLDLFILPQEGRTVEEGAAKINGYTPELWAERKAMPLVEAYARIGEWLNQSRPKFLAHNARFDREFFDHYSVLAGSTVHQRVEAWLCSMLEFRKSPVRSPNHKLETLARLCGHWGPEFVRGAHGSNEDAIACAAGYRWLMEQQKPKEAKA